MGTICITLVVTLLLTTGIIVSLLQRIKRNRLIHSKLEAQITELTKKIEKGRIDNNIFKDMERLSIVATQTDNAIMIMNPNGDVEWINDGFTRMYEYTFEEFLMIRGDNILKTSFSSEIKERLERCIRTKQPVYYEAINVTPSGRKIWTHTSLTPIVNDDGEVIHLATIDSDISERKEAGDALVDRVNGLSKRINELTAQQQNLLKFVDSFLEELGESNKKISETDMIVNFINELSDKIRIMGLNASIESHSVGSLGSGFRVLSGEIVKMSDETKKQAMKINGIVDSIKLASDMMGEKKKTLEQVSAQYQQVIKDLLNEVSLVEKVAVRLN